MLIVLIQFLAIFSLILILHELGHFIAAKAFGVEVEEFGIGLPPRIVKLFTWQGTDFTLNWLPLGAFVMPKNEFGDEEEISDGTEDDESDHSWENASGGGFKSAKPWQQLIIYLAGPLMNLLTMLILMMIIVQSIGVPVTNVVMIDKVLPDSPAEAAGVLPGDIIDQIDGVTISKIDEAVGMIRVGAGNQSDCRLIRNGEPVSLKILIGGDPNNAENSGFIGVVLTNPVRKVSLAEGVRMGFRNTAQTIGEYLSSLWQLVTGQIKNGFDSVVGPVGMFSIFQDAAESDAEVAELQRERAEEVAAEKASGIEKELTPMDMTPGWINRVSFFMLVSMAVGIMNLLPFPALDGGRIVLLLGEIVTGKKIPGKVESGINLVGLLLVLGLGVVVIFKDILSLIKG